MNAALTYYGNGAPGTSPQSKHLLNATLTPALTLGYKTGNALNMNLFTSFTGSGVYTPYEYAFTVGSTGVLSSGKVTSEYNLDGTRRTDKYNSHDNTNRNQIVGGASIKIGNFMISSFNDIYKPPLFFGMGSDQYWSAGVNMQAKITDKISMGYAFDLYYGKSNNKNPYNWDKWINYQNYDHQRFYDLLLNRGQETFSFTDANGNLNTTTKFGYGTFWPSNKMHDSIVFPDEPKKPEEPVKENYKNAEKYEKDRLKYLDAIIKYKENMNDYRVSMSLKQYPTFHHLFVVYKNDSNKVDWDRVHTYLDSGLTTEPIQSPILKKFYLLDEENKKKSDDEK
jgi:hypothetical protein